MVDSRVRGLVLDLRILGGMYRLNHAKHLVSQSTGQADGLAERSADRYRR
jgi:hypothetical protein